MDHDDLPDLRQARSRLHRRGAPSEGLVTFEVRRSKVEEQTADQLARRSTLLRAAMMGVDEETLLRQRELLEEWVCLFTACSSVPASPEVARVVGSPAHRLREVERELDALWGPLPPLDVLVHTLLRLAAGASATTTAPLRVDVSTRNHHRLARSLEVSRLEGRVVTSAVVSLREDVVTVPDPELPRSGVEGVVAGELLALVGGPTPGSGRRVHLPLASLSAEACEVFDQLRRDGMGPDDALDAARRLTPEV